MRAGDVVRGGQDIGSHGLAQLTHELLTAIGVDFQRFWVTWFRAEAKFGEAGRRGVAYLEEDSCTEGAGIESDGFCLSAEDLVVTLGGLYSGEDYGFSWSAGHLHQCDSGLGLGLKCRELLLGDLRRRLLTYSSGPRQAVQFLERMGRTCSLTADFGERDYREEEE
jgi:hypothetical protein